ncbi:MAG: Maf family nucleotide pyrophosphatase [Bacteroidales bacterium]|nr:Maf family nucleotide pyrophosphatase [Bacteroidales bacterium]
MNLLKATPYRLLLASNSPRRRELLKLIDPDYQVAEMHDVDESYPADLAPEKVPEYLSRLKAEAYKKELVDREVIITADTVVIIDGQILGKPKDDADAVDMLMRLMGRTHTVVTGVTLMSTQKSVTFAEATEVTFDNISRPEIEAYVRNFRPMDKAGAYGIQEWIGCVAISGIRGCFYNVMGLPLHTLYQHLRSFQ